MIRHWVGALRFTTPVSFERPWKKPWNALMDENLCRGLYGCSERMSVGSVLVGEKNWLIQHTTLSSQRVCLLCVTSGAPRAWGSAPCSSSRIQTGRVTDQPDNKGWEDCVGRYLRASPGSDFITSTHIPLSLSLTLRPNCKSCWQIWSGECPGRGEINVGIS